MQRLALASVR